MIKINSINGNIAEIQNDCDPNFSGKINIKDFNTFHLISCKDEITDKILLEIYELLEESQNQYYLKELTEFFNIELKFEIKEGITVIKEIKNLYFMGFINTKNIQNKKVSLIFIIQDKEKKDYFSHIVTLYIDYNNLLYP